MALAMYLSLDLADIHFGTGPMSTMRALSSKNSAQVSQNLLAILFLDV
jgi:hypothetical protein